jgi:serine/threonine protein kinase
MKPFSLFINTSTNSPTNTISPTKRKRITDDHTPRKKEANYLEKIKSAGLREYFTQASTELKQSNTPENKALVDTVMKTAPRIVFHRDRQFETCSSLAVYYDSSVYTDSKNHIVKVIEYNDNYECADFDLVKEVATQNYVYKIIAPECGFKTPRILSFGKVSPYVPLVQRRNYNCAFFIVMEKVDDPQLKDYLATAYESDRLHVNAQLAEIKKCLSHNHIYHNDIHVENVMVGADITIIDWGRGSTEFDYTRWKDSTKKGGRRRRLAKKTRRRVRHKYP